MTDMVHLIGFGGTESGGILAISAPVGAVITVTNGKKCRQKTADTAGLAVFRGLEDGIWEMAISFGGKRYARTVMIGAAYEDCLDVCTGYLYQAGNEYPLLTGGWSDNLVKNPDSMVLINRIPQSSVVAGTKLPFNTTGFSKITFHVKFEFPPEAKFSCTSEFGLLTKEDGTITSVTITGATVMESAETDVQLDITQYQGEYVPFFSLRNNSQFEDIQYSITVYSIAVE